MKALKRSTDFELLKRVFDFTAALILIATMAGQLNFIKYYFKLLKISDFFKAHG